MGTKNIRDLIPDIYTTIQDKKSGWFTDDLAKDFAGEMARRLQTQLSEEKGPARLRLSKMGPGCPCALWHSIHHPEMAEPLPPWAELKYSFGHILEAMLITLAKAAGHEVTGEQDELELDGIKGHRDCVIDGYVVDIKSSSSRGFLKFKDGSIAQDDAFGYLDQLDGYLVASKDDPLVKDNSKGYLLAIDKQLGHLALYQHTVREEPIKKRICEHKQIISLANAPSCSCKSVPDGKSGNMKLNTKASYSPFKYCCKPNLRTFIYAEGPRFLTEVVRKPDVPEVNKYGSFIY